jgi:uncharacterized protein (UPF0335 family)
MEEFDDEFGDLSQFKILSFEEVNQGFTGNNAFANTIINKDNSPDYRSPFHDYKNTPSGYSYLTDDPVSVFPSTGINEKGEKGYEYRAEVLPCENGSQVLGSYNSNKREPQGLFLFYEKPNPDKSNFAGDFYAAKMGDYFVQLFKRFPEPLPSSVGGKFFRDITSLEDEAAYLTQLAYTYEGDKINATLVRDALMREYQFYTNNKQFDELLGNISQIPADAIGWCAAQLEDFKPDEKNYDPASKDYSPLIPVFAGATVSENMNKAAEFFEDLGSNPFVQGVETAFSQVWELVKQSASKVKDASIDHLPDSFKKLVTRITGIINTIKTFLSEIKDIVTDLADKGIEFLKILNAFLCGIINGLVSLVQCILYILEFLLQPTTTFSYQQYLERRDLLEKAEDVLDWVYENMPVFLEGVKNLFSSSVNISQSDFENIFDQLKEYWDKASRYTIAFYTGLIAFEFIINILLLIFTAGEGNVVKGATYVQKASSLLRILVREAFSAVTFGITDLLLGLGKLITKFAQVCKKGWRYFIIWIEELLGKAKNGAKIDDVLEEIHDIEEVIINGSKKKSPKDFTKPEALEYLKKHNLHEYYSLYDLQMIWLKSIILKASIKDLTDFVKTGSLLKIERKFVEGEMKFFTKQLNNKFALQTSKLIKGKNCLRDFDIANCGGEILNLDWQNIEIFEEGLDLVKAHLERFESVEANRKMINRLEKIIDGEIKPTDFDRRFYTHEIREYRRFKNLGHKNTGYKEFPENLYDDAHSSTLEDFKIYELDEKRNSILYHPEIDQDIDLLTEYEKEILKIK